MTDKEKLIIHMLESLETPRGELNSWELDFVGSLREQFETRRSLSERQFEVLERIYTEKTA
jgi:hypothetical protein